MGEEYWGTTIGGTEQGQKGNEEDGRGEEREG